MLSKEHSLFFPKLKLIREGQLVRKESKKESSGRPINIYKLDWTKQEEIIKKKHEDWNKQCWPNKNIPFVGQLPEEWDKWLKDLVFAINYDYLREIQHLTQLALSEWNRPRLFDTMVRELCLSPSISMIRCAFFLIGDCVYDEKNKWYASFGKTSLAEYIMIYKFWSYQTGRGLLWYNARLDKLEERMDKLEERIKNRKASIGNIDLQFIKYGKKLLEDIKEYEKVLNDSYKVLQISEKECKCKGDKQ